MHVPRADGTDELARSALAQREHDKHAPPISHSPYRTESLLVLRMHLVREYDQAAQEQLLDRFGRDPMLGAFLAVARVPIEACKIHPLLFYTFAYTNATLPARRQDGQCAQIRTRRHAL